MTLTASDIEQFQRDGYIFPVDILDASEVADIRAQLQAEEAKHGGKLLPAQRSKGHLLFKWLDDLIRDPRVLDPVEQLIGPNILCWNTLFWIKEADHKSFVGWHQDTKYWGAFQRQGGDRLARPVTGEHRGRVYESAAGLAPGRCSGTRRTL